MPITIISVGTPARHRVASAALLAIAGVHAFWATGSSWPLEDRDALSEAVIGRDDGSVPPASQCLIAAGLFLAAASVLAGRPARRPAVVRLGRLGVTGAFGVRGIAGLAGITHLLAPGSESARFRRMDRRVFAPFCLVIAALSIPVASRGRRTVSTSQR